MLYELNAARALLPEGGVIISDPVQKAHYLRRVRQEKLFRILWRNAAGLPQHWRVFRYQLLGYVPALAAHLSLLGRRCVHQA